MKSIVPRNYSHVKVIRRKRSRLHFILSCSFGMLGLAALFYGFYYDEQLLGTAAMAVGVCLLFAAMEFGSRYRYQIEDSEVYGHSPPPLIFLRSHDNKKN